MKFPAGVETKKFSANQILFSNVNGWRCSWTDVSGTDANSIAGCHAKMENTGGLKLRET